MISILLCTYNREKTIKESVDSILTQTYEDFELILVDDGSTDQTRDILERYHDPRIRLFLLPENRYYNRAANFGITQMKGDYLAIANSDDIWYPSKLERQMEYMGVHPECGACFTFADIIDENGNNAEDDFTEIAGLLRRDCGTQEEWMRYFFRDGNCLAHPSALIPKWMVDEIGGFHLLLCQGADLEMWIRVLRRAPIHVIPEFLTRYRCHHDPKAQVSGADDLKAARFMNEHMMIRRQLMKELSDEELIRYFQINFRKKDASTHLELEIERAFLLLECTKGLPNLHVLGIEKFEEILRIYGEEAAEVLLETYGVRLQDIYKWNLEHFYVDFGMHVQMAERVRIQQKLEQEYQDMAGRFLACEKEKTELDKKLLEAGHKNEEQSRKNQELSKKNQLLEKAKKELEQERAALRAERSKLQKDLEQEAKKAEELGKENTGLSIELKKAAKALEVQKSEADRLLHQLEQQVLDNVRLKEEKGRKRKRL